MGKTIDISGNTYGYLTVEISSVSKQQVSGKFRTFSRCKCVCGKILDVQRDGLVQGRRKSCGCMNLGESNVNYKHGFSGGKVNGKFYGVSNRLYGIWSNMVYRGRDTKGKTAKNYALRGIHVCQEWQNDFLSFYNWVLTSAYDHNLTIDRIDNNKGYSPFNCRWASKKVQNNNRRSNRIIEAFGVLKNISEWWRLLGTTVMGRQTFTNRINKGSTVENEFKKANRHYEKYN